uniref:Auxin-responsive protein n=1 Tax=Kalanchoe fedtschenkoi TaxID=63787 RepID=A0A7N0VHZ1_KALFE
MKGSSRNEQGFTSPQWLNLVAGETEWVLECDVQTRGSTHPGFSSEEKTLELTLGPPGGNDLYSLKNSTKSSSNNLNQLSDESLLCLGSNSSPRNQNQRAGSSSNFFQFPKPHERLVSDSTPQSNAGMVGLQCSDKHTAVPHTSHKRTATAPVVGWPPIRSFRKNIASSSKTGRQEGSQSATQAKTAGHPISTQATRTKGLFVKINMDGIPIGRKVDLSTFHSYEQLMSAVDDLFRGLLAAQRQSNARGDLNGFHEEAKITCSLDGSGEYTLVYDDNEGDGFRAGDVPWDMFVSAVRRLHVVKSSDLSALTRRP